MHIYHSLSVIKLSSQLKTHPSVFCFVVQAVRLWKPHFSFTCWLFARLYNLSARKMVSSPFICCPCQHCLYSMYLCLVQWHLVIFPRFSCALRCISTHRQAPVLRGLIPDPKDPSSSHLTQVGNIVPLAFPSPTNICTTALYDEFT